MYRDICGSPAEDDAQDANTETMPTTHTCLPGKTPNSLEFREAAAAVANGISATDSAGTSGGCESPKQIDGHENHEVQQQFTDTLALEPLEAAVVVEPARETAVDSLALITLRQELGLVKNRASGLEVALQESRSEVQHLRKMLSTEEGTKRKQAGKLVSLRYCLSA